MKTLLYIICFLSFGAQAQDQVSVSIFQDAKLATIGDQKHGYKAGTLDLLFRLNLQGQQREYGYMVVFPEYEYSEISGSYKRYSANVGYTLNRIVLNPNASIGYGWIDRYGKTFFSWGLSAGIAHPITKNVNIHLLSQYTQRTDLQWLWGIKEWRFSGFVGLEIMILE